MSASNLTSPIAGIENRTAQEVFDIMCDRILSAIEVSPSPREQALEEAAKWHESEADGYEAEIGGTDVTGLMLAKEHRVSAIAIRALSSQPVADHIADAGKMVEGDGWLPIETCPPEHVLFFGVDRHGDKVAVEGFKAVNGTLCVGNKDLKPFTFTHWRPLPASPEVAG